MQWSEVSISTVSEAQDVVAEIFHDLGASGVVIEDPEVVNGYIQAGGFDYSDMPPAEENGLVLVKAYLPDDGELATRMQELNRRLEEMQQSAPGPWGPCRVSSALVRDEDWADNWKAYFHTEKVGALLVVRPAWEEYEASPDDIVISLDPGAAFGTGTHPTTAMCLRELELLVRGGMRVFDVGTGSGVLAIAAAKLGAGEVVAMDYDGTAVKFAEENIQRNGLDGIISLGQGDLLAGFEGKADLICANLIADLVIRLVPQLDGHLAEGGRLLASGIITERLADVTAAVTAAGFTVMRAVEEQGWAALVIGRR